MIEGLAPYADYRRSPLPWAPRIPAHWDTKRGKALLAESHLPPARSAEIVTCFRDGQVTLRKNRRTRGFMLALYEAGYQGVRQGQLVVHAMDAFAGAIGVSDSDGKCTPEYIVCDPRSPDVVPEYFALILRYAAHQDFIRVSCPAVRERAPRFRYPHLGDMQLPLPTRDEQVAIVRFLEHASRRIERHIRAKRKLIALLNEQKQAIIHRAVTRGLDPTVPTKESGVPWLGEIPKHWELTKLKHVSPGITVGIVIQPARLYVSRGVPCLRSLNISSGSISLEQLMFIGEDSHRANAKSRLQEGDVVLVRTGKTGVAAVVPKALDGANCVDLLIVRKSPQLRSLYLLMYLRSHGARTDIAFNSVGAIQAHYNTGTLANLRIPLPPLVEQDALLHYLDESIAPLDRATDQAEREISLIREYRTRLIADIVTGQLDVREAAARLPAEESDQPDSAPLDDEPTEDDLDPEEGEPE